MVAVQRRGLFLALDNADQDGQQLLQPGLGERGVEQVPGEQRVSARRPVVEHSLEQDKAAVNGLPRVLGVLAAAPLLERRGKRDMRGARDGRVARAERDEVPNEHADEARHRPDLHACVRVPAPVHSGGGISGIASPSRQSATLTGEGGGKRGAVACKTRGAGA